MNSHRAVAAIAARRRTSEQMLDRVHATLRQMQRERARITVRAVAVRAGVSRTFLYQNPPARTAIAQAAGHVTAQHAADQADQASRAHASWRERALNAEEALKAAYRETQQQRHQVGELHGRIRDLEADLPADAVQHLTTDNTTLRHQVRQLTEENRILNDRLTAARDNNRSQDKLIAALQAELLQTATPARRLRPVPALDDRHLLRSPDRQDT